MVVDVPRALLVGRAANLRDLGGLPAGDGAVVRHGRLLRSATLVHHDGTVLDELTAAVGAGVYFDLRTDREVDRDGDAAPLVARGWRWHRLPIQDVDPDGDDEPPVARYGRAMPRYVAAARAIGEQLVRCPVGVVACSLGKDRTGLVVAVLLRRLGVPLADIGADFALSNTCLAGQRQLLPPRWRDARRPIGQVVADDCLAALAVAEPSADPDPVLRGLLLTTPPDEERRGVRLD